MSIALYIAGPMTGLPEYNYPAFHAAATAFRAQGYKVLSPAEDDYETQLTAPDKSVADKNYHNYIRSGIEKLLEADAVHMLKGWQLSSGASLEQIIAVSLGLPITYEEGALQHTPGSANL